MLYGLLFLGALCFNGYMVLVFQTSIPTHYLIAMIICEIPNNTLLLFHPIASGKAMACII